MKTNKRLVEIAKEISSMILHGTERIGDELMTMKFCSSVFNWADAQILEDKFGDSLHNFTVHPFDEKIVAINVVLRCTFEA